MQITRTEKARDSGRISICSCKPAGTMLRCAQQGSIQSSWSEEALASVCCSNTLFHCIMYSAMPLRLAFRQAAAFSLRCVRSALTVEPQASTVLVRPSMMGATSSRLEAGFRSGGRRVIGPHRRPINSLHPFPTKYSHSWRLRARRRLPQPARTLAPAPRRMPGGSACWPTAKSARQRRSAGG